MKRRGQRDIEAHSSGSLLNAFGHARHLIHIIMQHSGRKRAQTEISSSCRLLPALSWALQVHAESW